MELSVLVAYASKHGTTREVAETIAEALEQRGLVVEIEEAGRVHDITHYDAVIVGGGLYMGKWHADARRLLDRHRSELMGKHLAVFGIGPDSLEEAKVAESRKQLDRALSATPELAPIAVTIFGGALQPENWRFPLNRLPAFDARDWDAIHGWADEIAAKVSPIAVQVPRDAHTAVVVTLDRPARGQTPSRRSSRREDAEHFVEEVRTEDPELANYLRIEERELEAGGMNQRLA